MSDSVREHALLELWLDHYGVLDISLQEEVSICSSLLRHLNDHLHRRGVDDLAVGRALTVIGEYLAIPSVAEEAKVHIVTDVRAAIAHLCLHEELFPDSLYMLWDVVLNVPSGQEHLMSSLRSALTHHASLAKSSSCIRSVMHGLHHWPGGDRLELLRLWRLQGYVAGSATQDWTDIDDDHERLRL